MSFLFKGLLSKLSNDLIDSMLDLLPGGGPRQNEEQLCTAATMDTSLESLAPSQGSHSVKWLSALELQKWKISLVDVIVVNCQVIIYVRYIGT